MDEIVKTCCFTGPRPKNYPWGRDKECEAKIEEKLKIAVQEAVKRGYRHFISGMAAGIDLLSAKIVLQLREDMLERGIVLEAAIPFPDRRGAGRSRRSVNMRAFFRGAIKCIIFPIRFPSRHTVNGMNIWSGVRHY